MAQRDRDVLTAGRRRESERFAPLLRSGFFALVVLLLSGRALAGDGVHLAPTGVEATPGRFVPAASSQDDDVRRRGAELDGIVREALEDMGLEVVAVSENAGSDGELPAIAAGGWAFAPRLELRPTGVLLRIVGVAPGSRVLLVREEDLEGGEVGALSVRTIVMVRDIVEAGRGQRTPRPAAARPSRVHESPPAPRSDGRPVLALNSALLGGYLGFTLQRASGSADSRLVYPMVALGAGLGLGASLLVADEWDIGEGDAWYLAAGMYWPGASGYLLATSYGTTPEDRFAYGLMGATAGVGLGTVALATGGKMSKGGAVLTHSGGAFGLLFGAMTEVAIDGSSDLTPTRGMGFGTGAGVLAAGVVATQVDITASRMLLIDLSVSLGWLGGAAIASPFLFVEEPDETNLRLWLGAAAAGSIAGGVIGWFATEKDDERASALGVLPYARYTPQRSGGSSEVGLIGTF
ncbi:MAG TPA: hypothetical protein VFZ53_32400 [Polyangiaceae bacterium]